MEGILLTLGREGIFLLMMEGILLMMEGILLKGRDFVDVTGF